MSPESESEEPVPSGAAQFDTTHWSVVLAAGHRSSPDSDKALESLCGTYWYPLYAYARRRVGDVHQAQDLTQEFFARLLEKNCVGLARPERGRFRSFLLTTFQHFLVNEFEKAKAQKRGGGRVPISLDFESADSRYSLEPVENLTPERLYEKQWALTLIDRVLDRLQEEFARAGKTQQFEHLKVFIYGKTAPRAYADAARELGMTEGAARVAAHRLRRRYRQLLWAEIAQTVAQPEEIDDEIRSLFAILGS